MSKKHEMFFAETAILLNNFPASPIADGIAHTAIGVFICGVFPQVEKCQNIFPLDFQLYNVILPITVILMKTFDLLFQSVHQSPVGFP